VDGYSLHLNIATLARTAESASAKGAAAATDMDPIRSAEEAYCNPNGSYADMNTLRGLTSGVTVSTATKFSDFTTTSTGTNFLAKAPKYNAAVTYPGTSCGATNYTVGPASFSGTNGALFYSASNNTAADSFLSNEEALVKLIGDKSVDVVVVAAGQPAPLIANMKPEAQKFIKLLKFDPSHPSSKLPLTVYSHSVITASSYPNLLKEDFTTVSVGAFLVTYDYNLEGTIGNLTRFARSLCQNFSTLQAQGHPKWREVNLSLPALAPGWTYYSPTTREIRACLARTKQKAPARKCSAEERILGFCN